MDSWQPAGSRPVSFTAVVIMNRLSEQNKKEYIIAAVF